MTRAEWRVLIADDEPAARRGVRQLLTPFPEFAVVGECRNGDEVLASLDVVKPDVVFLDVQMPGVDGFEVIRRRTPDRMPLVVFLTAYDEFAIRDDQRGVLQKNADYLRRWTSVRATIEGHADERGTNEYNLALGERRANAVRDYLAGLGISADRFAVVSKGREEPLCKEDNEACHQRNRRGVFIITAK